MQFPRKGDARNAEGPLARALGRFRCSAGYGAVLVAVDVVLVSVGAVLVAVDVVVVAVDVVLVSVVAVLVAVGAGAGAANGSVAAGSMPGSTGTARFGSVTAAAVWSGVAT